jgi:hypothetical protein
MKKRFTLDGSTELEAKIAEICRDVTTSISDLMPSRALEGIALGGGYGRGEGGVLQREDVDEPYNDVEFFVFVWGSLFVAERRWGEGLRQLGHELTEKHGIEVEFKLLTLAKLRSSSPSMFYYDLMMGHHWALGNDQMLAGCEHHLDADKIPLHEATRLMVNRCSSLLFAAERLARRDFTQEDLDFSARNIAKAQLALGDVILTTLGKYHWSCIERHQQLTGIHEPSLPMEELLAFHQAGVAFKLRPNPGSSSREALQALHQAITKAAWAVWTWQEQKRLTITIDSPIHYARGQNKCPETSPFQNALVRLRAFGL